MPSLICHAFVLLDFFIITYAAAMCKDKIGHPKKNSRRNVPLRKCFPSTDKMAPF